MIMNRKDQDLELSFYSDMCAGDRLPSKKRQPINRPAKGRPLSKQAFETPQDTSLEETADSIQYDTWNETADESSRLEYEEAVAEKARAFIDNPALENIMQSLERMEVMMFINKRLIFCISVCLSC